MIYCERCHFKLWALLISLSPMTHVLDLHYAVDLRCVCHVLELYTFQKDEASLSAEVHSLNTSHSLGFLPTSAQSLRLCSEWRYDTNRLTEEICAPTLGLAFQCKNLVRNFERSFDQVSKKFRLKFQRNFD